MNDCLSRLAAQIRERPRCPALQSTETSLTYQELGQEIHALAASLDGGVVALLLENGAPWVVADFAIAESGGVCVPLPAYFSDTQMAHVLTDAGVRWLLTDQPERAGRLLPGHPAEPLSVADESLWGFSLEPDRPVDLPPGTVKITYTSGTTGQPKGVCLSARALDVVSESLREVVEAGPQDRSLPLLPLATLLENIGAVYAALASGACVHLSSARDLGLHGASRVDPQTLLSALHRHRPTVLILVPQLLRVLVEAAEQGITSPDSLRFVAVGGAPVTTGMLRRAEAVGLPVYQGYGLSEAASVVALNQPGANGVGSVGRVLPHVQLRLAEDGEIWLSGELFLGYLGHGRPQTRDGYWPTGDLGRLDGQGWLYLTGRKRDNYITAFGRNVSPAWVEAELTLESSIEQALVFGEARPENLALIVSGSRSEAVAAALERTNQRLPDYARVARWILLREPFSVGNGLANALGRPRREAVWERYQGPIEQLYNGEQTHDVL